MFSIIERNREENAVMLEKIFGKKSTGIIYIFSASILLLSLAAGVITFVLSYPAFKFYYLVVQAVVTAFSLIAISLPVFVQKRYKFFIPPFIEISLCVYVVLLFFLSRFHTSTVILNSFLPSAGGFILSMVIFSIEYSLFSIRAQRQGKKKPSFAAAVLTVLSAFVLILFFAFIFCISAAIAATPAEKFRLFMLQSAHFLFGSFLFSVTGYFIARSKGERFRIRRFKNADNAKKIAIEKKNRSMLSVVENVSADRTDYKKAFLSAKTKFYLIRILYLGLYAAYTLHACIAFSRLEKWGAVIIFFLISSFVFTSLVYVYEYILFRRHTVNQRLRKLKIVKTAARSYTLALILAAMYVADYHYNQVTAFLSVGMLLFNLSLLVYNLFGKPRYYPSVRRHKRHAKVNEKALSDVEKSPFITNAPYNAFFEENGGSDTKRNASGADDYENASVKASLSAQNTDDKTYPPR